MNHINVLLYDLKMPLMRPSHAAVIIGQGFGMSLITCTALITACSRGNEISSFEEGIKH